MITAKAPAKIDRHALVTTLQAKIGTRFPEWTVRAVGELASDLADSIMASGMIIATCPDTEDPW
jgi:hypothetical protein